MAMRGVTIGLTCCPLNMFFFALYLTVLYPIAFDTAALDRSALDPTVRLL